MFSRCMKGGPFDLSAEDAEKMLTAPLNPNGRPNSDVVRRRLKGRYVVQRDENGWLIDFVELPRSDAALYEVPFAHVRKNVKPLRDENNRKRMKERWWWLHGENRPGMRRAIAKLGRCIVTPEVSKHRLFAWMNTAFVPDHKLHVIARDDDYFMGALQSHVHEIWTLATCSWIGKGNDPSYKLSDNLRHLPISMAARHGTKR